MSPDWHETQMFGVATPGWGEAKRLQQQGRVYRFLKDCLSAIANVCAHACLLDKNRLILLTALMVAKICV